MATLNQEIIAALSHLVRLNEASELGFETAAEHAREPGVKYVLREFARQRAASATELRAEIELWGGAAMEQPDPMAAFHRGWIDLKAGLTLGRDNIARVVLDECVRGENVALRRYQQAQQELLPETVQTLIQQHVVRRQADYDKLCRMAACGDEALLIRL
ncbi:MAG: PA2169 family four-helix-bundle protein, partial [Caldilineaceae bacterium]|nr:PA2169 family four-helix-bundle protein [Caldilineaceae bacterium]